MGEDFHEVFFCVSNGSSALDGFDAVVGNVEGAVGVEEFEDVAWWRNIDDIGCDELIHSFMVGGMGRVVEETRGEEADGAGEEGETD